MDRRFEGMWLIHHLRNRAKPTKSEQFARIRLIPTLPTISMPCSPSPSASARNQPCQQIDILFSCFNDCHIVHPNISRSHLLLYVGIAHVSAGSDRLIFNALMSNEFGIFVISEVKQHRIFVQLDVRYIGFPASVLITVHNLPGLEFDADEGRTILFVVLLHVFESGNVIIRSEHFVEKLSQRPSPLRKIHREIML